MSTNPTTIAGRPTNVHERVSALAAKANAPMVCPDCGSTFFYQVRAEEYSSSGYASAQFRSVSMNTEPLYICPCGSPVEVKDTTAGKITDSPRQRFLASLKSALEFRKSQQLTGAATGFVSVAEYQELAAQVQELTAQVAWAVQGVEALNSEAGDDEGDETDEPETPGAEGEGEGEGTDASKDAQESSTEQASQTTTATAKPAGPKNGGRTGRARAA